MLDLLGEELSDWKHTKSFVAQYNKEAGRQEAVEKRSSAQIEKRLEQVNSEFDATFNTAMMAGFTDEWIVRKRQALTKEEHSLRERLDRIDAVGSGPAKLEPDGVHIARDALARLLDTGPIDTSTAEGAGVVAGFRRLVSSVSAKVVASGELELSIQMSPKAVLSAGSRAVEPIVLTKRYPRPQRAAVRRHRNEIEWEAVAATGAHCLGDEEWRAIKHLLPKTFNGKGQRFSSRTTLEAALFHLRNRAPRERLPACFGKPMQIGAAVKRLGVAGWWRAVEPVLRELRPDLLEGVVGSMLLPVGEPAAAGAPERLTPLKGLKAGVHRLSDDEWLLLERAIGSDDLGAAGLTDVAPRDLIDVMMFLAKERLCPNYLPKGFGRRADLEQGVCWMLREGGWSRIVDILRRDSRHTLYGVCTRHLERYFSPSRRFKHRGGLLIAAEMAAILRRIEAEVAAGVPSRTAAASAGVTYQRYLRFRTHPLLKNAVDE